MSEDDLGRGGETVMTRQESELAYLETFRASQAADDALEATGRRWLKGADAEKQAKRVADEKRVAALARMRALGGSIASGERNHHEGPEDIPG